MDSLCLTGMHAATIPLEPSCSLSCPPRKASERGRFSFKCPLQSLWSPRKSASVDGGGRYNGMALDDAVLEENAIPLPVGVEQEGQNGNWVLKILQVRSLWKVNDDVAAREEEDADDDDEEEEEVQCEGCEEVDEDEEEELDMDSFSKSLKRVSLPEAKLYAQMSYLGNLAYCIPRMKAANLLRRHGLKFVTSSIDKRELAGKFDKEDQVRVDNSEADQNVEAQEKQQQQQQRNVGYRISMSAAYHVAASAASYLHSHAKGILPTRSGKGGSESSGSAGGDGKGNGIGHVMNPEIASLMATTDSVTAVVAAKEEVKQAVADDLNSIQSSPCEWFICDDDQGARYFVIQGSETLASWQANLLFEPVHFEGLDVPVHRGIYEAAKGMYEQMLPEVRAHLKSHGENATFRFTGHSLGGSLSLLLNLLLLIRGEVPASSLLPVITFGAPSVMCGGDHLLRKLGLPLSHVQAITMHRDIVPRVFSCNYPSHVAEILKAVNGRFRKHPCLNNQKLLYTPMGELLILQPDEKFSPHHHLLPEGSGLYFLSCPLSDATEAERQLRAAQSLFLNSPHPLEILSDRSAYGSGGTIRRDHDMNSYLRCMRNVIRQDLNQMRKAKRENRRRFWWSILSPNEGSGSGVVVGRPGSKINTTDQNQFNISGVIHTGRESIKRFTRLVASQHMQLLVVLLLPARLLLVGAYNVISLG